MSCRGVLADHEQVLGDVGYSEQPRSAREAYEREVAYCLVEEGEPTEALALTGRWREGAEKDKRQVEARAYAQLGQEARAREALEALMEQPILEPRFFLEAPEFRQYASQGWFIALAIHAWTKGRNVGDLSTFVRKIASRGEKQLLPLSVAVADHERPPGDLVLCVVAAEVVAERRTRQRTTVSDD